MRTERSARWGGRRRPGTIPGRSRTGLAFALLVVLAAMPAAGQEIFAWFNRDLLPVHFRAGDRVRYEVEEIDELGPVTDTLTVTVLDADSMRVWLRMDSGEEPDYVALDPRRLRPGGNVLDALVRVVRSTEAGLVDEDVDGLRESALVQRHFSDPFERPLVRRTALPDTVVDGRTLSRERALLEEERREEAGPFVVVTRLWAQAELSPDLPLIGLLSSRTLATVTTEAKEGRTRNRRPPLVTEHLVRCLGFERSVEVDLPELPPAPE